MYDLFAGAFQSAKALVSISQSMVELRDFEMVRSKMFDLNNSLMELQQQLMDAQTKHMDLLASNMELERQLRDSREKNDLLARYKLANLGNGHCYKLRDESSSEAADHLCCTVCMQNQKLSFLSWKGSIAGDYVTYSCSVCNYRCGAIRSR